MPASAAPDGPQTAAATSPPTRAGFPDPRFGTDGTVVTTFPDGVEGTANAVAVQRDGRIVVAGTATSPDEDARVALVRYLPDGRLDPAFGEAGRVLTGLGGPRGVPAGATAVAVAPDGRIVVGVSVPSDPNRTESGPGPAGEAAPLVVLRYLADGRPDPEFGDGGMVVTEVRPVPRDAPPPPDPWSAHTVPIGIAVDPRGRVVVGADLGPRTARGPNGFALARYLPDGRPDPRFGRRGLVTGDGWTKSFALLADGRILTSGQGTSRFRADGSPDPAFGGGGRVRDIGGDLVLAAPGGRVVVSGAGTLHRLRWDGSLDASFGDGGVVRGAGGMAGVDRLGRVIAVTGLPTATSDGWGDEPWGFGRYTPAGLLDRTYGGSGTAGSAVGDLESGVATVDRAGSLLVVGRVWRPDGPDATWALSRIVGDEAATRAERPCVPSGRDVTCTFTGAGAHLWRVPDGVREVRAELHGAQGGGAAGGLVPGGLVPGGLVPGGLGGRLKAMVPVHPGGLLQVGVGGRGADGVPGVPQVRDGERYARPGPRAQPGTGGAAQGGAGWAAGGAGGGASWLGTGPDRDDVLVMAGGGGGAAPSGPGGGGGGADGLAAGAGGFGATPAAPGAEGYGVTVWNWFPPGIPPMIELTGPHQSPRWDAAEGGGARRDAGGGGGGGGWFRGGGGGGSSVPADQLSGYGPNVVVTTPGGPGGGGSGHAGAGCRDVDAAADVRAGDGLVLLRYRLPAGAA